MDFFDRRAFLRGSTAAALGLAAPPDLFTSTASAQPSWDAGVVQQMLFMDAPAHTRLRGLASKAFTIARVEQLRGHIKDIIKGLLDGLAGKEEIDIIAEIAEPLPAIVTAELMGVPTRDHVQLKEWSADFAEK